MMQRRRPGRAEPPPVGDDPGPMADPESIARTIVLSRLAARARSRQELADTLAERGVPDEVATRVLDRLGAVGLVDDAVFAKTWVESRQVSRGLSRRALRVELRRKGVDADVITESLEAVDDEAEYDAARALVEKKLRSARGADSQARWRQLVGLLARRGYPPGVAIRVVRDVLASPSGTVLAEGSGDAAAQSLDHP